MRHVPSECQALAGDGGSSDQCRGRDAGSAALSRSIRYSLRQVRDVAVTISEGNLGVRNVVVSQDELGELGHAINNMADRLNEVIGRLRPRRTGTPSAPN